MIPKFIHFITGFGNDDFGLIEYVAVASARKHHPDWKIFIWHGDNVGGDWWDKLDELHVQKTWVQTPTHFRGKEVPHHAHRADLLRLPILYAHGGLYLDTDTITLNNVTCAGGSRPNYVDSSNQGEWVPRFHPMDVYSGLYIPEEFDAEGNVLGLCNAVMFAEPLCPFIARWIREYENFDPSRWGDMSVQMPLKLFNENPEGCSTNGWHITLGLMPYEFEKYWSKTYFKQAGVINETLGPSILHLWRTFSKPYMDKVTIESCAKRETAYEYHAAEVLSL